MVGVRKHVKIFALIFLLSSPLQAADVLGAAWEMAVRDPQDVVVGMNQKNLMVNASAASILTFVAAGWSIPAFGAAYYFLRTPQKGVKPQWHTYAGYTCAALGLASLIAAYRYHAFGAACVAELADYQDPAI